MITAPLCSACHLPVNVPAHLPPPGDDGVCAACTAIRQPGFIERLATNAMPACFTPTRESYVRMASYVMLLRASLRICATSIENMNGGDGLYDADDAEIAREARKLAGEMPRG